MKWDEATERRLLLLYIAANSDSVRNPNWQIVADAIGSDVTADACSQHFRILKRKDMALFGDAIKIGKDGGSAGAGTTKTGVAKPGGAAPAAPDLGANDGGGSVSRGRGSAKKRGQKNLAGEGVKAPKAKKMKDEVDSSSLLLGDRGEDDVLVKEEETDDNE